MADCLNPAVEAAVEKLVIIIGAFEREGKIVKMAWSNKIWGLICKLRRWIGLLVLKIFF